MQMREIKKRFRICHDKIMKLPSAKPRPPRKSNESRMDRLGRYQPNIIPERCRL